MLEVETITLAAALKEPSAAIKVNIKPEDFSDADGATIWRALTSAAVQEQGNDPVMVLMNLGQEYRELGGQLLNTQASPENLNSYAKRLRQEAQRRRLQELLAEIDTSGDPDKAISQAMAGLVELTRSDAIRSHTMKDLMRAMVEEIDQAQQSHSKGLPAGLPSGFSFIDRLYGGWHRTDLVTVAGRPGMGKTAFLLSSAIQTARQGYSVGIVSAEMAALQLGQRALAGASGVSGTKIRNGDLQDGDYRRIMDSMTELAELPIKIMDPDRCTPAQILTQAHVWAAEGLDMLYVDYLQLLRPDQREDNHAREVSEMAKSLKSVAKALNIPVMALAQLNRNCENRQDKRPMMADLRESGGIEEASDAVMFLYRDCVYHDADERSAELLVGKSRHGPIGTFPMQYVPERLLWTDPDIPVDGPAEVAI